MRLLSAAAVSCALVLTAPAAAFGQATTTTTPPPTATTPAQTTPATTAPAPTTPAQTTPPTTAPAPTTPATTPSSTTTTPAAGTLADRDSSNRARLILLAVCGLLLAIALVMIVLVRWWAWEPDWLVRWRHATGEAGWRASNVWAEFGDWLRLGR
jgi:hypothetical protein